MPDIALSCPECGTEFPFTETEQAACAEQAFPPPTYCPDCTRRRKAAKEEARGAQRGRRHRRR
jgi:hypothetical protein